VLPWSALKLSILSVLPSCDTAVQEKQYSKK
jgi:hypothetical protein